MLKAFSIVFLLLLGGVLDFLLLRPAIAKPAVDFPQFYFAGQLVRAGQVDQIYQPKAYEPFIAKVRNPEFDKNPCYYFNRPAFAAFLYWPYSFLSFETGSKVFVALNLLCWALLIWKLPVWLGAPRSLRIWLVFLFPFAYAVGIGQDTLALMLILVYSMCVLIHRNQIAAGTLLALCLVKPHLVILLPLLLIAEKKFKALTAFAVAGFALAVLSLVLVGPQGVQEWLDLLKAPTTDFFPEHMGNIRVLGLFFSSQAALLAGIVAILAAIFAFRRADYLNRLSILLMSALLFSPHSYWGDYVLLAIVALVTHNRFIRYAILIPWPYFVPIEMWPMTLCTIGFLVLMALEGITLPFRNPFGHRPDNPTSSLIQAADATD